MIARKLRGSQLVILALLTAVAFSSDANAQYKNPRYRASGSGPAKTLPTNKKTPVQSSESSSGPELSVPSYSSDSSTPAYSAPTYSNSTPQQHQAGEQSGQSLEVAVNLDLPVAIGEAGQGLKSKWGINGQLYLAPMLDPSIHNYIAVGFENFSISADPNASFRFVPVTVGLEWRGLNESFLKPVFGVGLGGVYAFVSAPDAQIFNGKLYFMAQIKGGFEVAASDGLSVVFQTPVNIVIGSTKMSYISYSIGARFGL